MEFIKETKTLRPEPPIKIKNIKNIENRNEGLILAIKSLHNAIAFIIKDGCKCNEYSICENCASIKDIRESINILYDELNKENGRCSK